MDVPEAENRAAGAGDALGWIVDRRTRLPPSEEWIAGTSEQKPILY